MTARGRRQHGRPEEPARRPGDERLAFQMDELPERLPTEMVRPVKRPPVVLQVVSYVSSDPASRPRDPRDLRLGERPPFQRRDRSLSTLSSSSSSRRRSRHAIPVARRPSFRRRSIRIARGKKKGEPGRHRMELLSVAHRA